MTGDKPLFFGGRRQGRVTTRNCAENLEGSGWTLICTVIVRYLQILTSAYKFWSCSTSGSVVASPSENNIA